MARTSLIAASVLAACTVSAASIGASGSWNAPSLGLPSRNEPWRLIAKIEDAYVMLRIPEQLPAIDRYPASIREKIRTRIRLRDQNIDVLSRLAGDVERLLGRDALRSVPQYERFMDTVVIGIYPADAVNGDPFARHEPLLRKLPDYTRIHAFIPGPYVEAARARLRQLHLDDRTIIHAVAAWEGEKEGIARRHTSVPWTQDLFRVAVNRRGTSVLLAPAAYLQSEDLADPDNDFVKQLTSGGERLEFVRLPVFYHTGNMLLGRSRQNELFIGKQMFEHNASLFYNAVYALPASEGFVDLMKRVTGADRAHVLPNSRHLFHLDMAMAFVDHGVAVVLDPLDREAVSDEDQAVLGEIRKTLRSLGFRIIPVPTLASRIRAFQSPVNIVAFTHRSDNRRYALIPEYPDVMVQSRGKERSLNAMIRDAYANAGITAVTVEDRYSSKQGSIHCVLKVIN